MSAAGVNAREDPEVEEPIASSGATLPRGAYWSISTVWQQSSNLKVDHCFCFSALLLKRPGSTSHRLLGRFRRHLFLSVQAWGELSEIWSYLSKLLPERHCRVAVVEWGDQSRVSRRSKLSASCQTQASQLPSTRCCEQDHAGGQPSVHQTGFMMQELQAIRNLLSLQKFRQTTLGYSQF